MDTSSNKITPLKRFWRLLKPDSKEIKNVYVYSIFNGLILLSLPLGIQAIINLIQGGQISTSWVVLVVIVVAGVASTGVLHILQLRITENLQQKIFTRAAFEFAYRIPRIKMEELYKHYAPELMNRFFDTISLQKGLSKVLIDFSSAALQVVFGLLLLSFYHPFFILFSIGLVLIVFAIFRLTAKKGLQTSLIESKEKYKVAHWLEELARTHTTFKLAGRTELPLQIVDQHVGDYLKARDSHFKVLVQQYSLMVFFKVLVATGLLAIGGILVMEQQMNIGQFVAAEIIILTVMTSVEKLITSLETIYDVLTSLEKIGQVSDMEIEEPEGIDFCNECSEDGLEVKLDHVTFSYPDNKQPVLKDISLEIKSGERLLISGSNGAGKSSLLQIIAGLYQVQEGTVSYNNLSIKNLQLDSLRSVIGDSLSYELLFNGSLKDNITMGRPAATFDNLKWAIRNLNLEESINALPNGLDTHIDPEGKKLPKSFVQKLLLARSIVDKPRLLILEDAFNYIDVSERKKLFGFITDRSNPWTLVAVSSDDSLAAKCDYAVVLSNGRIINN